MAQALISSSLATTPILLLLLCHLFIFSSPTTATTNTTTPPVLDIEGNPVEVGSEYHIISQGPRSIGGLRLRSRPNLPPCPKYVFRTKINGDPGRPVEFLPSNSAGKTINVSDVIGIRFTGNSSCDIPSWHLINKQIYVSAGRAAVWKVINSFKIEKMGIVEGLYKIRYYYYGFGKDLGILEEKRISWLGVSDEPLPVYFVKKPKQYNEVE